MAFNELIPAFAQQRLFNSKEVTEKRFTYQRSERLTGRKKIQAIFSSGMAFHVGPFRVFRLDGIAAEKVIQAGVGVSSRNFKKAVDRNRIKRLMRESYRLQKNPLEKFLKEQERSMDIFILYTGRVIPTFDFVFEKTGLIIGMLIQILDEKSR